MNLREAMNDSSIEGAASGLSAMLAVAPHAVRWAKRDIPSRHETEYSKWHWTINASVTICGRPIQLIADGPATPPETHDDPSKVTCACCRSLLMANAKVSGLPGVATPPGGNLFKRPVYVPGDGEGHRQPMRDGADNHLQHLSTTSAGHVSYPDGHK